MILINVIETLYKQIHCLKYLLKHILIWVYEDTFILCMYKGTNINFKINNKKRLQKIYYKFNTHKVIIF